MSEKLLVPRKYDALENVWNSRGTQVQHCGQYTDSCLNSAIIIPVYPLIMVSFLLFLFTICNEVSSFVPLTLCFDLALITVATHCIPLQSSQSMYCVLVLCCINRVQEEKDYGFRKCVSCLKLWHSTDNNSGRQPQWSIIWSDSSGRLLPLSWEGKSCQPSSILRLWSFRFGWN